MLNVSGTTIICIDLQEKLVNMLNEDAVAKNSLKLLKTASMLDIETILTDQYPKGLGSTIDEIKSVKAIDSINTNKILDIFRKNGVKVKSLFCFLDISILSKSYDLKLW